MTRVSPDKDGDAVSATEQAVARAPIGNRRSPRAREVEIVFTPEQIAYLDERMRVLSEVRPTRRTGGSSLSRRLREDLLAT